MKYVFLIFFLLTCNSPDSGIGAYNEKELSPAMNHSINRRLNDIIYDFDNSAFIPGYIERFMLNSGIKGISLAIIKDEKLVYANSFGYADDEQGIRCTPEHLFRIASVSKLITAVGIMKLVEEGRINLNDYVFGEEGFFNAPEYLSIRDPKLKGVTVLHLLNHTSGWTQRYGDPMFNPQIIAKKVGDTSPASLNTYLKYVITHRLYYLPGTTYCYSNMGYMFLGAIIEKVSGMRYEDFIKNKILFPNGIFDMHIAANFYEDKLINEVRYYEQENAENVYSFIGDSSLVQKSYGGNNITLLGAAGGWIASAPELARFLCLIDGFDKVPDILSEESIKKMTQNNGEKPLGWKETTRNYWYRTGSFAGTSAMVCRQENGFEWVFLSNTSSWKGPEFSNDIVKLMGRILREIPEWPKNDLFNYYDYNLSGRYPIFN